MIGFLIALVSGALMSIQGVFNTQVTKSTGIWTASAFVQFTALLVCLGAWLCTERTSFLKIAQVEPRYMLLGGAIGAFITYTVIRSMDALGPAKAVMLIVVAQLAVAYIIELFGWFGVEKQPWEWRKAIGMAVAIVIGAAILIYLIFTNSSNLLFSNRADVQVISFVGMTKDEFLATDYNNLLRAEFPEEYSSEPAGTIIRQTPKAGRTVKEKQRIVLTVSLGTQYVTIPETKNMVAEDAEQTLKDMGLRVTKKPMSDNSVANGAVVYTQPAAGETVEGDSTVILYVSRSEVSKESQVPSLTGKTIEEARNEVKGLNLSIRTIEQASEQPAGTVLSQSPDAGSTVRKSSVITLVVSTGVPEVVATPEPVEPTVNEDGTITVQESWWPSADGSHQIHQLTDGTMWNENGQRCDAQGNPIA